mmetsp:Transcript_39365/g.60173  ORF Transcript_39365/g.60173 Transcript_39365/m.60173 type:complete len:213 (+) Transcript_39365:189-827(+)
MIASIDGAMFGTPEDEIDSIISSKMRDIIAQVDSESGSDPTKLGDSLDRVQFGLKLVPNMDQHTFLLKRMSLAGGEGSTYTGLETNIDYDMSSLGEETTPFFYEWNEASHMNFASFNFDEDHVPLGDSGKMCLGLSWTTIKKRNQYDKYIEVKGFDQCDAIRTGHTHIEGEYPKRGLNFKLWLQQATKGDSLCKNGIYASLSEICYTYQVMK